MRTNLYRCFDADGQLLYVGVSWSTAHRFSQHQRRSSWWSRVARIELEHYRTRQLAERAERQAIRDQKPPFNTTHSLIGPAEELREPGAGYWQIRDAHYDGHAWHVELIAPDGRDIAGVDPESGSLLEAVEYALDASRSLLMHVVEEQR